MTSDNATSLLWYKDVFVVSASMHGRMSSKAVWDDGFWTQSSMATHVSVDTLSCSINSKKVDTLVMVEICPNLIVLMKDVYII